MIWTYFRLPEPKGRTYGELDILFENRVSARNFSKTDVTQLMGHTVRLPSMSESGSEKDEKPLKIHEEMTRKMW